MHSPTVTVKPASPDFVYFVGVTIVTPTKYTKSGEAGFTVTVGLCIRG